VGGARNYEDGSCDSLSNWDCPYVHGCRKFGKAARELGVEIKVETEGSVGAENA